MGILAKGVDRSDPPPVGRPARSRRGRFVLGAVAVAGAAGFAVFQLWQAGRGMPTHYPDTEQYVAVAGQPLASRAFVAGIRLRSRRWSGG